MNARAEMIKGSSELTSGEQTKPTSATPPVDIYESDRDILILADMPGVDPANLEVHLEHTELKVVGRQTADMQLEHSPFIFERMFRVPSTVDPEGVNAVLRNGVLELRIGKTDTPAPRRIEVRAG